MCNMLHAMFQNDASCHLPLVPIGERLISKLKRHVLETSSSIYAKTISSEYSKNRPKKPYANPRSMCQVPKTWNQ